MIGMKQEKSKNGARDPSRKEGQPQAFFSTGKRKKSIARASIMPGKGIVTYNSVPADSIENRMMRLLIQEPLSVAGDSWKKYNIKVSTRGGGIIGQAQAARQAIAKCLAGVLGKDVKAKLASYDRNMLVYDPRRTEPHKPPRSSQGPRRYKQRSKR